MVDVAVVIVSWNTKALTLDALRTFYDDLSDSTLISEVWVVDNASEDGSPEAIAKTFPQVNLIASKENHGFGAGNNLALRAMGFGQSNIPQDSLPQTVYLLNSDTRTHPGATQALFKALMTLPDAGVTGARLTFGDGSFQHSAFAFPGLMQLWIDLMPFPARFYDSSLNGRYPRRLYEGTKPFEVEHTLGATMMLKREVIVQTGMFDEQFVMYAEEVDWSWRIQQAGWKIYCIPEAHVTHLGGQSTSQVRPRSLVQLWTSRLLLYEKYYPRWKKILARQLVRRGMARGKSKVMHMPNLTQAEKQTLLDAYDTVIALTLKE